MKRYFVRYLESRRDMTVVSNETFIMNTSFDAGLYVNRNSGHRRKGDALAWIDKINKAAGKVIAEYGGAHDV